MKYVQPAASMMIQAREGELVSFSNEEFVRYYVDNDTRFNSDGKGIRASVRIDAALRDPVCGHWAFFPDDLSMLVEALESPRMMPGFAPFPLRPARLCAPFIEALSQASDERPVASTNGSAQEHVAQ